MTTASEILDRFDMRHGPCCAGCDWWAPFNSTVGECRRSAPVAGEQRVGMLGVRLVSLVPEAGHVMTYREHHCGEFQDAFDWGSLPAHYLRRIGAPAAIGLAPAAPELRSCTHCGEGVTTFCRGKADDCPSGLPPMPRRTSESTTRAAPCGPSSSPPCPTHPAAGASSERPQ